MFAARQVNASVVNTRVAFAARALSDIAVNLDHHSSQSWVESHDENLGPTEKNYRIQTYNKISPKGLAVFPSGSFEIGSGSEIKNSHAILLRSYKLKEEEVGITTRAIAR